MAVTDSASQLKTVGSPNAAYESILPLWRKSRAMCSGERFVKDFDGSPQNYKFLIPFSPTMTQAQYAFYRSEAELPGITAQFAKMIVGGLLRKQPVLTLPDDAPEEAVDWIMNDFGQDDSSIIAFLDKVLWEEVQTNRTWVQVDYPKIENTENLVSEDLKDIQPYPIVWEAETVINWQTGYNDKGKLVLTRIIKRGFEESFEENEFHPKMVEKVWVHELYEGKYRIRIFEKKDVSETVVYVNGRPIKEKTDGPIFELIETIEAIEKNGERLNYIPIWPLNGNFNVSEPLLMAIIDKETSLYNKMSRRNHLLYGAATYTPYVKSRSITQEEFDRMVAAGLGSWLWLQDEEGDIGVLETPTDALKDMESAIANGIEELAKLGIRMLTPETAQSGVALEIRNASQTAQLGTFNTKVSNVITQVITLMLNWKYNTDYKESDIDFSLSADFNPTILGADWMRLVGEWYQDGIIPRSVFLQILKQNDVVDPDYNDDDGKKEINDDELTVPREGDLDYANTINQG